MLPPGALDGKQEVFLVLLKQEVMGMGTELGPCLQEQERLEALLTGLN